MNEPDRKVDPFLPAIGWKARGMALLRFLAFAAASGLVIYGLSFGVRLLAQRSALARTFEGYVGLTIVAEALGMIAATAAMAWLGRRSVRDFGLGGGDRASNFLVGIGAGGAAMALVPVCLSIAGAVAFAPGVRGGGAAGYGLFYAGLMLAIAFAEEGLCRGYALVALSQALSFWPAALAMSAVFALLHGLNEGETAAGLAAAACFGMVLAYSHRRTSSLWFAYGFHGSWDFVESYVFGLPNSGLTFPGGLFRPSLDGSVWLTGGSAGPEGSVFTFVVLGASLVLIRKTLRAAHS